LKKDRQHNGQKKKDKGTDNDLQNIPVKHSYNIVESGGKQQKQNTTLKNKTGSIIRSRSSGALMVEV
jgi:hypothetical protein